MKIIMPILIALIIGLCILQALGWVAPPPPAPPPPMPYRVRIVVWRSDNLSEGFRPVATNDFWSTKSQGFYRFSMEVL